MASTTSKAVGGSAALAAVLAIAAAVDAVIPITQKHEGYVGKAYYDPVHVLTQCYGETKEVDPSRIYSKDECAVKLRRRMQKDYAPAIAKCMPVFVGPEWPKYTKMFGAFIDASYNTGPFPVCKKFGPLVNSGNYRAACNSLPGWYVTGKNRKTGVRVTYPGLVTRRKDESALCLKGIPL